MQFHFLWVLHDQQYRKAEITGKEYNSERRKKEVWEQVHRPSRGCSWEGRLCTQDAGTRLFHRRRDRRGFLGGGSGKGNGRGPLGQETRKGKALREALTIPHPHPSTGFQHLWWATPRPHELAPAAEQNDSGSRASVSDHHCSFAQMSHAGALHIAIQKSISRLAKSGTSLTYFHQTGEASNTAISETAKMIRKGVRCCTDQPEQIQPWGKINLNSLGGSKYAGW